jgi:Tol biopolymer transport system component
MKYVVFLALAAAMFLSCGEDPTGPEEWPDGAVFYLGSEFPDTSLSWSPGGNVLLFTSYAYDSYGIWGFDGVTDPIVVAGSYYNESSGPTGCWSGSQGLIVYTTFVTSARTSVRTVPGNLGLMLEVINDGREYLHPTWTPDEDSLLLCCYEYGFWGLWKTEYHEDSLLTPQAFYTPSFDCLRPSYSPDGNWLLFQVNDGTSSDVWLMAADGSDPHPVIADTSDNIHPCWGPVSDHFAFSSNRSGNYEIWISDLDGTDLVQVTDDPYSDIYPAWNPTMGWIAFSSNRDDDGGSDFDILGLDTPDL